MAGIEIDRSAVSTCLAKAIAYQQAGKTEEAEDWARELIAHLQLAGMLSALEDRYERFQPSVYNYTDHRNKL